MIPSASAASVPGRGSAPRRTGRPPGAAHVDGDDVGAAAAAATRYRPVFGWLRELAPHRTTRLACAPGSSLVLVSTDRSAHRNRPSPQPDRGGPHHWQPQRLAKRAQRSGYPYPVVGREEAVARDRLAPTARMQSAMLSAPRQPASRSGASGDRARGWTAASVCPGSRARRRARARTGHGCRDWIARDPSGRPSSTVTSMHTGGDGSCRAHGAPLPRQPVVAMKLRLGHALRSRRPGDGSSTWMRPCRRPGAIGPCRRAARTSWRRPARDDRPGSASSDPSTPRPRGSPCRRPRCRGG